MVQTYSVDWNGTDFLLSGDGISNSSFPTLSLYENNYYVFNNTSIGDISFSIGENINSNYINSDIWNNNADSEEYLLFSPDSNTSRVLYYFNPDDNSSVGRINVYAHESQFIHPDLNVESYKFGQTVKINDWNQTIIGSTGQTGIDDGAVHVFNMESNGSYSYFQKILPPTPNQGGHFGYSLSVDDDELLIGSPDVNSFSGLVHSYNRETNGSYNLKQDFTSFSLPGDSFGWDISVSDLFLAVSSRQANNSGSGKVSIFEHNGTEWGLSSSLFADDNQSDDEFGYSIQLLDTRLLVGAPFADADANNSGAAYIFEQNSSGWFQTAKLSPSALSAGDEFGYSVALEGNLAFVGARQKDGAGLRRDAGAVYVFKLDGLAWVEVAIIYPPEDVPDQYFSSDISINQGILAVSSPSHEEGFVYLYRVGSNGGNIQLISTLNLSDANSSDQSHLSIGLAEGFGVIGIPGDSTHVNVGGGALVFHNDAWQTTSLPLVPPLIDRNATTLFSVNEDSGNFVYDFNSSFPYDSNLTWTLSSSPSSGAISDINPSTGLFEYTPDGNYSGLHELTVTLSAGSLFDTHDFNVSVTPLPDPPIFTTPILSYAMEGDDYNQSITVFDADFNILTLSSNLLPSGLSIVDHSIQGIPEIGTANGSSFYDHNFTLSVRDDIHNVDQNFTLRVLERNNPPQISVDGNTSVSQLSLNFHEDINATTWYQTLPSILYSDLDGHSIELSASVLPSHGSLVLDLNKTDSNQSLLYTPELNYTGIDTFTICLRDTEGEGNKSTKLSFNLNLSPVNDPPVFIEESVILTAYEGIFFEHNFSFVDPDGNDTHSLAFVNLPSWIDYDDNFTISQTPSWTDYSTGGYGDFLVTVTDQHGSSSQKVYTMQIIPNNYPPIISPEGSINISLDEDLHPLDWSFPNISVSDSDTNLSNLNWSVSTNASHGTVSINGSVADPIIDYIPDANYSGIDLFKLSIVDSSDGNSSDTISFNININPIDDAPVFESIPTFTTAVVGYDWNYSFSYKDSDNLSGVVVEPNQIPNWLNLFNVSTSTGSLRGSPLASDLGDHNVSIQVVDPGNLMDVQNFVIEVVSQNTPPRFTQGEEISLSTNEDELIDLLAFISVEDRDKQKLTWTVSTIPSHGELIVGYESNLLSVLNYIPRPNFAGTDLFELKVSDGIAFDTILVSVSIISIEDSPYFVGFPTQHSIIDYQGLDLNITFDDEDGLAGLNCSMSVVSFQNSNWLSMQTDSLTDGKVRLSGFPSENDEGNYSITITVEDPTGLSVSNTCVLEVFVLNLSPIINDGNSSISVSMIEDSEWIKPTLFASDFETNNSELSWSVASQPSHGDASIGTSGENLSYVPEGNFSGSVSFSIQVQDSGVPGSSFLKSDSIDIQVTIQPVNDAPVFTSQPVIRWNDESDYIYQISTFDSDSLNELPNLELNSTLPEWLNFRDDGNGRGVLAGNPSSQNIGQYDISLKATDSNGSIALQNYTLSIEVDNYPPQIKTTFGNLLSKTKIYAYEDTVNDFSKIISFSATDKETPINNLSWSLLEQPTSGGSVQIEGNGTTPTTFTYSPIPNFSGEDIFTILVSDGERSTQLEVTVFVIPVMDNPVVVFPSEISIKEGEDFNVSINSSDVDLSERFLVLNGINGAGDWLGEIQIHESNGTVVLGGVPPFGTAGSSRIVKIQVIDSTALTSTYVSELKINVIPHDIIQKASIGPILVNEDNNETMIELSDFFIDDSGEIRSALMFDANSSDIALVQVNQVGSKLFIHPQPNLIGDCLIHLTINSGNRFLSSSFQVSVLPIDDPPHISQILPSFSVSEDSVILPINLHNYFDDIDSNSSLFNFSVTSSDEDILSAEIINQSLHLFPSHDQSGTTSISIMVNSSGLEILTDFNITILPVNDPPEIIADAVITRTISEDLSPINWSPLTINAIDIDSDKLTWRVVVKPENGNYSFLSGVTGNKVEIDYQVYSNYFGTDSMIVEVSDGELFDRAELKIHIESVDDIPFMKKQIPTLNLLEDDNPYEISLGEYFSDIDSNENSMKYSIKSTYPNLVLGEIRENRLVVFPQSNQSGNAVLWLDINSSGKSFSTFINVQITPVDDPPYLVQSIPSQIVTAGQHRLISLLPFFNDNDDKQLSFTYSVGSSNTELVDVSIFDSVLSIGTFADKLGIVDISVEAKLNEFVVSEQFSVEILSPTNSSYSEENIILFVENSLTTKYKEWKSNWFGYFTASKTNWIYHTDFEWIMPRPSSDLSQLWFWSDSNGWLWTSSDNWQNKEGGHLYSYEDSNWLFLKKVSENKPMVYDYDTKIWSEFR
ncbi:MAG: tandem-95 repeat protein [Opitutales bacterium]|nr:tandem-95 repeat protein [Opitutales bacterium]